MMRLASLLTCISGVIMNYSKICIREIGNFYMRTGMVRAAVLISGETIYDQKPCNFTFESTEFG